MKADLTRSTDKPDQHYRSVRMQQGRVQLDADWNEQQDILNRRIEQETQDSLGAVAAPLLTGGFKLSASGKNVKISAGHLYVNGLLCDNPAEASLVSQPSLKNNVSPILPSGATLLPMPPAGAPALTEIKVYSGNNAVAPQPGVYLGYLEAWVRHITHLEDGLIREVALGGPDTATRDQLVWQVKLLRLGDSGGAAPLTCLSGENEWNTLTGAPDGTLGARAKPTQAPTDLCRLTPQAGFRRLENLLYRVEIHDDGNEGGKARYKWSRDNGSIVSRVVRWLGEPTANEFEVASIGRDAYLSIGADCWLEFFSETHELLGRPGTLVKVLKTEGNVVTLDTGSAIGSLNKALFDGNPRVRRWDGVEELKPKPVSDPYEDNWIALEDGVEVKFQVGKFRVGDYWTIPARTATADVEWPRLADKKSRFLTPQGVPRAFARLGLLSCAADGTWSTNTLPDCRPLFPALTELTNLYYVGGDGQQAMPNPLDPQPLPLLSPLQVAVYNGQFPVEGARVRFTAAAGLLPNGTVQDEVSTNADGIASIVWRLNPTVQNQMCTAELLRSGVPAPGTFNEIHFSASLAVASAVAYDPSGCPDMEADGVNTVQQALDSLCKRNHVGGCCVTVGEEGEFPTLDRALRELLKRGENDICLCLLPGDHHLTDDLEVDGQREVNLLVHGSGPASRLHIKGQAFSLKGFRSLVIRDFDIIGDEQAAMALQLFECQRLSLSHLGVGGMTVERSSLLQIGECSLVELSHLLLTASLDKLPGAGGLAAASLPGYALMLADAKGEVSLSDSSISGRISLYGESSGNRTLSGAAIKRLGSLPMEEERGKLYLSNNRLGDIHLGDDLMQKLKEMANSTAQPEIPGCFASLIANDNVLGPQPNQWLAVRVALSQNRLPSLDNAGFVIAKQAKYLGNFCQGNCHLTTSGHPIEQFGNGQLTIS